MIKFLKCILSATLLLTNAYSQVLPHNAHKDAEHRLEWWKNAHFGMFVHWGPSSLTGKEISWSRDSYGTARYDSLYLRFNPVQFNAKQWFDNAKVGGMKYLVFTAKHHDGFCNWNTKTTTYNIMNSPFKRDVCKELAEAAKTSGMKIGWYYSPGDWHDKDCRNADTKGVYERRMQEQLQELLTNYGKIDLLWIDFDGFPCPVDPAVVYNMARKLQPGIIINNRLDVLNVDESHSYLGPNGDYVTPENFVASFSSSIPWETSTNLGTQWAWKFNDRPASLKSVAETLLTCVGGNGNLLLNVGPDSLGKMQDNFVQRLKELGTWISTRPQEIYNTHGGSYTPGRNYVCTRNKQTLYLHFFSLDSSVVRVPPIPASIATIRFLDGTPAKFKHTKEALVIDIPSRFKDSIAITITIKLKQSTDKIGLIAPFSTTGSLAYLKKATASSCAGQMLHLPQAAFDDNPATAWKPGRKKDADFLKIFGTKSHFLSAENKARFNNTGWLAVDLGKPCHVSRIKISEQSSLGSLIKDFQVQYQHHGKWITIAEDTKMGNWERQFTEITAQKFRLVITDAVPFFGISEFELFRH